MLVLDPFSTVDKPFMQRIAKHGSISLETLINYMHKVSKSVMAKIVRLLPNMFALVFDGWSNKGSTLSEHLRPFLHKNNTDSAMYCSASRTCITRRNSQLRNTDAISTMCSESTAGQPPILLQLSETTAQLTRPWQHPRICHSLVAQATASIWQLSSCLRSTTASWTRCRS